MLTFRAAVFLSHVHGYVVKLEIKNQTQNNMDTLIKVLLEIWLKQSQRT